MLRFRDLGASFSRFGCFVLRASVLVFECFVFETTLRMIGSESGFELGFDHWVPLAKILGDIFIFRGTDKLIFIQHFFTLIEASQQNIFFHLILDTNKKS